MSRVIFQPAGNAGGREHYVNTVERPVPLDDIAKFVSGETLESLQRAHPDDAAPVWGVTPGRTGVNARKWERIEPGDSALFLQDGRAVSAGQVTLKTHAPELAKHLWDVQEDGQTWEYVYFLDGVRPVDIPYAALNEAAGYEAANRFQGFSVLDGPQADRVISLLPGPRVPAARVRFPQVWCVRAGRELIALDQFLQTGVIAIGWNALGDPRPHLADAEALKALLRERYAGEDVDSAAGVIRRFYLEVSKGDVVVVPAGDVIHLGRVLGDAIYTGAGTFHSERPVEWLTQVRRDSLTDVVRNGLAPQLTLFRVSGGADAWIELAQKGPRVAPRPPDAAAWLVRQAMNSQYADREGSHYEYPARIPNGRQIQPDDVLLCYRNRDEAQGRPIFGIGRIARIDPRGDRLIAVYDRYLKLRDPLSWSDIGGDPRTNGQNSINAMPREALDRLLAAAGIGTLDDLPAVEAEPPLVLAEPEGVWKPEMTMDDLVALTLWSRAELEELCDAIRDRSPQLILAGPPGTGKTWVARNVCKYLTQRVGQRRRTVQFHPSYSYEEFVEGLRPEADEMGRIMFSPIPGVLLRMVREIEGDPGPHILLIDEINRANLPRVLGELMYLFEYRDEKIDLRYRGDFSLPPSLRFLGTMNTADRSIRSLDTALRRRFDLFACDPRSDILERYYSTRRNAVANLISGFTLLNDELKAKLDRHHTIGHTFFMAAHFDRESLTRVWDHKVQPLIEEYFFDQPDAVDEFKLERFWPRS